MSGAQLAHSKFGGSIATRVLRCPASVGLVEKVPAYLRRISADAERGSALHAAMALLIERERSPGDLGGETIEGYRITADDEVSGRGVERAQIARRGDQHRPGG